MYLTIGESANHKKMQYNYSKEIYALRAKPIRITRVRISGVQLYIVPSDVITSAYLL